VDDIRLRQAKTATIMGTTGKDKTGEDMVWQFLKQNYKAVACWGRYNIENNSTNSNFDYPLGTAPPERRFWVLWQDKLELDFVEYDTWTDGEVRFQNPISLFNAYLKNDGIVPITGKGGTIGAMGRGRGPQLAAQGGGKAYQPTSFFMKGNVFWTEQQVRD
jgi:hypothetical protein